MKPVLPILGAAIVALVLSNSAACRGQSDQSLSLSPATNNPLTINIPRPAPAPSSAGSQFAYKEIQLLEDQGKYKEALTRANDAVAADPKNIAPYVLRGHIYSKMSDWDKADADYQAILQIDPSNFPARFNRCEVKLAKKDYDAARDGYEALAREPDWGDLASYKAFVCDLLAGHELAARSQLETFNNLETHASYFYANATWDFYHKQPQEAQSFVDSAQRIYPRKTVYFYSATLVDLGYIKPLDEEVKVP